MKTLNLIQGTPEWKKARLEYFTASEAPAMMNCSKYMSRNELLKLKKTGNEKPVSDSLQTVFDNGHRTEAMIRPVIEKILNEELYPVTGVLEDTKYSASFDGLTMLEDVVFEHKQWNEALAENVRNGVLEPMYYWQLEQQLMVSGADRAIFVVSNGTEQKMEYMYYEPVPGRKEELIAGWEQFSKDLEEYEVQAIEEPVIPVEVESFPLIKYQVKETEIHSNINEVLEFVRTKSQIELTRELETDQDFADKDKFNKATKKARADLKSLVEAVQGQFVSYSEFATTAKEIDSVLQKMQSHGEKQVREAKEAKKTTIKAKGRSIINDYIEKIETLIQPILLSSLMNAHPDFDPAMKNKRTIESLQNAADEVVANFKIEADQIANKVKENLLTMRELASEHKFLFSDTNQLVTKDNEDLIAVIKTRISDHEKAEEERLEKEREQIRLEEEAKAQKKIEDKQKAEEAGIKAKESVEKRETEIKKLKTKATGILDIGGVTQTIEDPPFLNQEEDDMPHKSVRIRDDISDWATKWKVSLEATQELSEILKEHNLI